MSGHSKWHSIRHKKAAVDAKRGRLFTRLLREIMVAARTGGGDVEGNPRLRAAVQAARDANMPKDNIERAIKKGTGEIEGETFEDFTLEGYGPAGVALMILGTTDNRNRTMPEIRHIFAKYGGSLGESGCVAWNFERKGVILADRRGLTEEQAMEAALEAGAEDYEAADDLLQFTSTPETIPQVRRALETRGLHVQSAKLDWVPKSTVRVEGKEAEKLLRLVQTLEDHDDVQSVAANFDMDASLIEQMS